MVELFPCCWLRCSFVQISWCVYILAILARFRLGTCVNIRSSRVLCVHSDGSWSWKYSILTDGVENMKVQEQMSREPRPIN